MEIPLTDTYDADDWRLPKDLREIAQRELNETDELRESSLHELRQRCETLTGEDSIADLSDRNLIRFLRSRKFNIERAFKSMCKRQSYLLENKEYLKDLNADNEEMRIFSRIVVILPGQGPNGSTVLIARPKYGLQYLLDGDPCHADKYPQPLLRFLVWLFDRLSFQPRVQVCGLVIINCFRGVGFWDALSLPRILSPFVAQGAFRFLEAVGLRIKAARIYEEPTFFTVVWSIVYPFLNQKLKERFQLCGSDYTSLDELFPDKTILPSIIPGGALTDEEYLIGPVFIIEQCEKEKLLEYKK